MVLVLLNLSLAVLTSVRSLQFAVLGQRSSSHLHGTLLQSVLAAPLAWSVGRAAWYGLAEAGC